MPNVGRGNEPKPALQEFRTLYARAVDSLAWNADGSRIVILGTGGKIVTLYDPESGRQINRFDRYAGPFTSPSIAFLPNGHILAPAPKGDYSTNPSLAKSPLVDPKYKTLQIFSLIEWDPVTAERVRYIPDLGYPPTDVTRKETDDFIVSPDATMAVGSTFGDYLRLYDLKTAALIRNLNLPFWKGHADSITAFSFSPDGHRIAACTIGGRLYIFDVRSGSVENTYVPFEANIASSCTAVAYSPNGRQIAVGRHKNFDGGLVDGKWFEPRPTTLSVLIINSATGGIEASLDGEAHSKRHGGPLESSSVTGLAWSPSGDLLAVGDGRSLRVWKLNSGSNELIIDRNQFLQAPRALSFSSHGVLAASSGDEVVLYK